MNAEIFAEWMRLQGQKVYKTESSYWHSQGPRVFQAFPYHWIISPSESELSGLLLRTGSVGLRYSTPITSRFGQVSYHAVLEAQDYGFDSLGKWARKNVRRGMKLCTVEPISFNCLADQGWKLQIDTLNRQGRKLDLPEDVWRKRCWASQSLPGFEAWGAFVDGNLGASVITFQMENCVYMLYQQCLECYLPEHVNNALSFVVTQTMMQRPGINMILYGLHSLDAPASVDEFKFRMGYIARPVRQRVVFNPILSPLFSPVSYRFVKRLLDTHPGNPFLAKTEGMFRFYLQGRRSLAEQEWPENMLEQKAALLGLPAPRETVIPQPEPEPSSGS